MNLTSVQKLALIVGVCAFLAGASSQIDPIIAAFVADPKMVAAISKAITGAFGLTGGIFAVPLTIMTSQGAQVKAVQAMPGVKSIVVSADANSTLATLAVDPAQDKIEAAPEAIKAVKATAGQG